MNDLLIIGAKSDIAKAIARKYATEGYNLYLAARQSKELDQFAKDLSIRSQKRVLTFNLDVLDYSSHQVFYDQLEEKPIGVIVVAGYMSDQIVAQNNFSETEKTINTNYSGLVSLLEIIASDLEKRKNGFIIGVSSVAGDRGRKSNYIYGSSKAAFTAYLSGLRNRLYKENIHVLTVKPGFVATKMTKDLNLPKLLTTSAIEVANDIYKGQQKNKNIIYTKWFWRWIMLLIKLIPEFKFKKMNL